MLPKQEVVAMLLAGGQGSRLGVLTKNLAKPAVPYGGKYRIIDFPLSNCVNSGIECVGVLTQYQPLELNEYIGNGQPWDLDSTNAGVRVLPPFQRSRKSDWYKGTANAIYQNIPYLERYNPEYVIVLSGDHIYKMDYSKMIAYHKQKEADCTIAVIEGADGGGQPVRHHEHECGRFHLRVRREAEGPEKQPGFHGNLCFHLEQTAKIPRSR
jgi:glucose-1-phosphate adenylyltransferase